jgi:hypothetical protein
MASTYASGRQDEFFEDALKFKPERFMKKDLVDDSVSVNL